MQNIHPLFVHFPIALLSVGLLCDILGRAFKKDSFNNAGWWCQVFGIAAIAVAAITGLVAESTVKHSDASHSIMETHKTFMLIAAGIFAFLFVWRIIRKTLLPQVMPLLITYFIIGAFGAGIMSYGAHLGGRLVYEFGVGTSIVTQPESGEHEHHHNNYEKSTENKGGDQSIENSKKSPTPAPVDTEPAVQEKNHHHEGGKEHKH